MKIAAAFLFIAVLLTCGTIVADRYSGPGSSGTPSSIIFAHANHTDLDCADCHDGIEQSTGAQDRNFPSMEVCGDCHDIESDDNCDVCHVDAGDPQPIPHPERPFFFAHNNHIARGAECGKCHGAVVSSTDASKTYLPDMGRCFECHDGTKAKNDCVLCHGNRVTLADIHPAEWRHQHGTMAPFDREWCALCHRLDNSCVECHRGDNLTGIIHDLNYRLTHGLDAKSKRLDCSECHDNRSFCYSCHERENRIPLLHSSVAWLTEHGGAARRDVESCAACHDSGDPTCTRSGCHLDADGLRGTDPRFHTRSISLFDSHGRWHDDGGYFCYRCHTNTRLPGTGFCGYCHGGD